VVSVEHQHQRGLISEEASTARNSARLSDFSAATTRGRRKPPAAPMSAGELWALASWRRFFFTNEETISAARQAEGRTLVSEDMRV